MSDVAIGVIGALAGTIIGASSTILVDHFRRKTAKEELKIQTLSKISASAVQVSRLVRSSIYTIVEIGKYATMARGILEYNWYQDKTPEERETNLQIF